MPTLQLASLESVAETAPHLPVPPSTVRVLHVINGEHYAGAERVQDLLAHSLPDCGFEVGFACVRPERFPRVRRSQSAPLHDATMRSRFDLRPAWRLARLIREEGYQLVHTHTPRAALVGRLAAWLARVPLVHHVHSPTSRDSTRRWLNVGNAAVERASLVGAAAAIGVSQAMGRYATGLGIRRERVWVVPNGVPVRSDVPERGSPSGHWTLGVIALFRPRKGLEVLLEALARLRSQELPVRLRAVGGFEAAAYQDEIHRRVERLALQAAIDWTGFTTNVTAELDRMDLFVLPSLFGEGLPMVVLEAMASGVPIVASNVEGVPEAIRQEMDGLLVSPGDPTALANEIARIVNGRVDWRFLREHALDRQRKSFSDESMAAGVAEVYRAVLGL